MNGIKDYIKEQGTKLIVEQIMKRDDVPVATSDAKEAASKTVDAINDSATIAIVDVKSPVKSKINILMAAVIGVVVSYLSVNGVPTTLEEWTITAGALAVPVTTVILKTWFSGSVSAQSLPKK